jgi:DNA-binding NtrC family response regulator
MALVQDGEQIESFHLSEKCVGSSRMIKSSLKMGGTLKEMVSALEKSVLVQLLEKHQGNRTKAAAELGLSRHGLRKKMQRYGI